MTVAAVEDQVLITEPGVYDIPDEVYHSDPTPDGSLSSHGARMLLPPSCPALFRYFRDNRRPDKPAFDFGHAAHRVVLGAGADLVTVDADDWRTKAAKEQRDQAYAEGKTPLLTADMAIVEEMADAIRAHPFAGVLFDSDRGRPEQSLFWRDAGTGVMRRARLDWLPDAHDGRMILPDYKTSVSAEPEAFARTCANFGYYRQAPWYIDGIVDLQLAEDVAFVFVVQEKTPPYLVTVVELDATAMRLGRALNRQALDVYADCSANDTWPGYADDVAHISLPTWHVRQHEALLESR